MPKADSMHVVSDGNSDCAMKNYTPQNMPSKEWNKDPEGLDKLKTGMIRNWHIIIMIMTYLTMWALMSYYGWVVLEASKRNNNQTSKEPREVRNTYKWMHKWNKLCNIPYAYIDKIHLHSIVIWRSATRMHLVHGCCTNLDILFARWHKAG